MNLYAHDHSYLRTEYGKRKEMESLQADEKGCRNCAKRWTNQCETNFTGGFDLCDGWKKK